MDLVQAAPNPRADTHRSHGVKATREFIKLLHRLCYRLGHGDGRWWWRRGRSTCLLGLVVTATKPQQGDDGDKA
jgi:hypothetical protein